MSWPPPADDIGSFISSGVAWRVLMPLIRSWT